MRRRGMFRKPMDVAIDKHLVCRYDKFDRIVKIDREFFAVDIMNMLDAAGITFTVPAIKTPWVKRAINEFKQGVRDAVSRHSITSADGSTAEFTLRILDRGDGKFYAFVTNASMWEVLAYNSGTTLQTTCRDTRHATRTKNSACCTRRSCAPSMPRHPRE